MKFSYLKLFAAMTAGVFFASCSGNIDNPGDDPNAGNGSNTGEITGPFTLSVDKTQIEADGNDFALFSLKDANGVDVTVEHLKYFSLENVETGDVINKSNKFTSIKNGTFTLKAKYKTYKSENEITITAVNRAKYEKYFRKVAAYEMTDVNCPQCPSMALAFENVPEIWQQQMTLVAVHGGFSGKDPWLIGNMPNDLINAFGGIGWPYAVFNLDRPIKNSERTGSAIGAIIEEQLRKYPATCGFKVSSQLTEKGDVVIDAAITSSTGGKYNIGYGVLVDGLEYVGGNSAHNDGIYNHVLVGMSGNYRQYSVKDELTLEKDVEKAGLSRVFEAGKHMCINITEEIKPNAKVFVYALRIVNGKPIIDNITDVKLGETQDYQLNK